MNQRTSMESQGSFHLPTNNLSPETFTQIHRKTTTVFEPQTSNQTTHDSANTTPYSTQKQPEMKLTLFALRLAILEKAVTSLGTLGFIWATVVLLGGFSITIDKLDFWLVTIILLVESTRIFSRSHELEWQHQATWSLADPGASSFHPITSSSLFHRRTDRENNKPSRTWISSDVPLLPYGRRVFVSSNVSKLLYWLQLLSAASCVFISVTRLVNHNFEEVNMLESDHKLNRTSALSVFYGLSLAEATLFLLEKAYWEWNVMYKKILESVNEELELGHTGMVSVRRFFYDSYSKSVNGSIFNGLQMDMVSFAMELLNSNSSDEQLIAVRIIERFATNTQFSQHTLQNIGINLSVMERLVQMLNWKDIQQEEIRMCAGKIIVKLVGKKQNTLRVAGIPGAMESISSLLNSHVNHAGYDSWAFNQLGLLILKKLARDHDNCGKIGNTRGMLRKIIDFMHADERLLKHKRCTQSQICTIKRSLQVVNMLVRSTGITGTQLRTEVSSLVFTVTYIRGILKYGEHHPGLQKHAIDILTSLALEDEARERIGGTGGVVKELFNILLRETQNDARMAAGEAIGMLAFESGRNCDRILKLNVVCKLCEALECPLMRVNAARIMRNLCIYSGSGFFDELRTMITAAPTVLEEIIMTHEIKLQEVMVGLAVEMFKFMTYEEVNAMFRKSRIHDEELAGTLVQILKKNPNPNAKSPRIRRYVIELAIWMMKDNITSVRTFKNLGMIEELEGVTETTSELESFNIFSGAIGLSRYKMSIQSLVETATKLMTDHT